MAGGSVHNLGTAALIEGYTGIYIAGAAGTVTNTGTISGTGSTFANAGIHFSAGGSINNLGATSLIKGQRVGVYIYGTLGTVTNAGTIIGVGDRGVALYAGGKVTNSGRIAGNGDQGVYIYGTLGTVINSGKITGGGDTGVDLYAGGLVTNSGRIIGYGATARAGTGVSRATHPGANASARSTIPGR